MMEWIRFGLTAVLLIAALVSFASAVTGVYRLDFVMNRMHAAGMGDTMGIFCVLLAAVWWSSNGISFNGIAQKGAEVASGIFHGLTHPDLKIMFGTTTEDVPFLIAQTIAIALLGTVIGGIVAGAVK